MIKKLVLGAVAIATVSLGGIYSHFHYNGFGLMGVKATIGSDAQKADAWVRGWAGFRNKTRDFATSEGNLEFDLILTDGFYNIVMKAKPDASIPTYTSLRADQADLELLVKSGGESYICGRFYTPEEVNKPAKKGSHRPYICHDVVSYEIIESSRPEKA